MAAIDQLSGLMDIINTVQGGGGSKQTITSSGGKQKQQTQLSDEAVQEQIKRILAGPGGVKDIGGAGRRSGLYNSTTEDTLLGNLYATAAAQGEIARAPKITTSAPVTQTTNTSQEGVGLGTVLGTVAGGAVLNKLLGMGGEAITGGISDLLGLNNSPSGKGSLDTGLAGGSFGGSLGKDQFGLSYGDSAGPIQLPSIGSTGYNIGQTLPGLSGDSFGVVGPGKKQDDQGFDLIGSITSAIGGLGGEGGGLGGLVGALTGGFGGGGGGRSGGTSGGSVICTALMEQGELDEKLYAAGTAYLQQLSPLTVAGYHSWAIGVADKIRKGSKMATVICRPFARSRTQLLSTQGTVRDHLANPLGTLTKFIGEPICWVIGWRLSKKALQLQSAV